MVQPGWQGNRLHSLDEKYQHADVSNTEMLRLSPGWHRVSVQRCTKHDNEQINVCTPQYNREPHKHSNAHFLVDLTLSEKLKEVHYGGI